MKMFITILLVCLAFSVFAQNETYADATKIQGVDEDYKITAFAVEADNTKYIGTDKGLLRITPEGIVESVIVGKTINAVALHPADGAWAAIEPNILYHPASGTSITVEGEDVRISCMDFSGGSLWVGTNNGVYVISSSSGKVTDHFTTDNSKLLSNNVNAIFVDESRLKWIGTDRGIARVENEKWKIYEKDHSITAITENSEGVWVASTREMWLIDPFNRWTPCDINDGLGAGTVRALTADKKGDIYILSDKLVQFDPYNDEAVEIEYDYSRVGERAVLMCDLEDKLWIGSLEAGLLTMDLEKNDLELSAYARVIHPACPGQTDGSISVTIEGGTPPYVVIWDNEELEGTEVERLPAGKYTARVFDDEGTQFPLNIDLLDPAPLSVSATPLKELSSQGASDGGYSIVPSGGTGDYSVRWSDGGAGMSRNDLAAGNYEVTVSDSRGCSAKAEFVLMEGPVIAAAPAAEEPDATPDPEPQAAPVKPIDAVDAVALQTLSVSALTVGQTLRIEQLNFPADSITLTDDSYTVLDEVYRFLMANENVVIEIGGHTNGLPDHTYCDKLSTSRARTVAEYLYNKGIPVERIGYKGYGKRQPIATNATVEGRRKNQRVEIKILEM